ncbi:MAG: IS110 family transposase [Aeromonadales bacterium]|nr:IS110 family transposase [Aeromonadales bacterium]MDY2891406.1 IS110 family transposase [Succinivibrio sp.]
MSSTAVSMLPQDTVSGYVDVGVDLAKNVFQVAYIDPSSRRLVNRQLTRARFYDFVCSPDGFRKRIAVEACGASHYWCREAMAHGHLALMIPASATRTFVQSNKSDMNDARAIWQLMHCTGIPTVRIRSEDNQMLGCLLKYREKLISEKTKLANWIRAQLYELGKITKLGSGSVLPLADGVVKQAQDEGKKWAGIAAMMNASWHEIMASFDENIKSVDEFIASRAKASRLCAKLMTVPSIGLVSATVLEYVMEDPSFYRNGRQFSAYSGFAPRHAGTGGKIAVLGVDSQGNHLLKRVLYEAAMSLYMRTRTLPTARTQEERRRKHVSPWVARMAERKPVKKVVCAIANRLCRIAWAVASQEDGRFDDSRTTLVRLCGQDPAGDRHSLEDAGCEFEP